MTLNEALTQTITKTMNMSPPAHLFFAGVGLGLGLGLGKPIININ